jgi:hypothetical protein
LAETELVERAIDPQYLRFVIERFESFRSHPLGFRVAGTPEERAAVSFVGCGCSPPEPVSEQSGCWLYGTAGWESGAATRRAPS